MPGAAATIYQNFGPPAWRKVLHEQGQEQIAASLQRGFRRLNGGLQLDARFNNDELSKRSQEETAMKTQFDSADFHHGSAPGIEHHEIIHQPSDDAQTLISCIDYSPGQVLTQDVENLEDFVAHHRPEWSAVRWISIVGLSNMNAIHA